MVSSGNGQPHDGKPWEDWWTLWDNHGVPLFQMEINNVSSANLIGTLLDPMGFPPFPWGTKSIPWDPVGTGMKQ